MAPSHSQWLIPFAVQLIPGGLLLIGSLWIKESPRWLFQKGDREQALANLYWIRNLPADDIYIVEEVAAIDAGIEYERIHVGAGFWKPFVALKDRKVLWRFFLGGMLFLWQNGSGINAINYYSPTVFKSIGIQGTNNGFLTTGIFGVVKTVVTFVWLLILIDRLGRRKLLMVGAFGGSLCMWFMVHTSSSLILLHIRRIRDYRPVALQLSSSSTSGLHSIPHLGTVPHGSLTLRYLVRTPDRSAKPQLQPITGSGTSSSPDSPPRCS